MVVVEFDEVVCFCVFFVIYVVGGEIWFVFFVEEVYEVVYVEVDEVVVCDDDEVFVDFFVVDELGECVDDVEFFVFFVCVFD